MYQFEWNLIIVHVMTKGYKICYLSVFIFISFHKSFKLSQNDPVVLFSLSDQKWKQFLSGVLWCVVFVTLLLSRHNSFLLHKVFLASSVTPHLWSVKDFVLVSYWFFWNNSHMLKCVLCNIQLQAFCDNVKWQGLIA